MDMKKLLKDAKSRLSNALDLIVEFSGCPKYEALQFSKVKSINGTLEMLSKIDFYSNKYFGRNPLGTKYQKDFNFRQASDYEHLREWSDNVHIVQNENVSIKTESNDKISIMDKRLGFNCSTMYEFQPLRYIDELRHSEEKAEEFLIKYFLNIIKTCSFGQNPFWALPHPSASSELVVGLSVISFLISKRMPLQSLTRTYLQI